MTIKTHPLNNPTTKPSTPIQQFSNFTHTSAGLEKILRLIQAFTQIAIELDIDPAWTTQWGIARAQLALARRFFRFFAFVDCFNRVYGLLGGEQGQGFQFMTLLHAMNVHLVSWNGSVLVEANKFWFYALSLSILGAIWGLLVTSSTSASKTSRDAKKRNGKHSEKPALVARDRAERTGLLKQVVVDGCDLLIPGVFVGWMQVSDLVVGVAMAVSTVLSGGDVWGRAQG
ncbi:hypothetical protein BDV28DRAFT_144635 [Aspergillus coremiiformis]|uniref:Peroxisomal biogenesis factor 11 n=1 Tax=Aspergillus coremiiformis TaxID=138285 RepID=A0A5N6ZH09_9EURO|nr:hypothetical protein BDV28DRAFT_144635 [Aspergillus coremiiformis]